MRLESLFLLFGAVMLSGCYTQLSTLDNFQQNPESKSVADVNTPVDSVPAINQYDKYEREREVCVWERDILGYPKLRCYTTTYPRDWLFYNNSPWWYRNDPNWYDYQRCPKYYYYDSEYGNCRHYTGRSDYYSPRGGSSGEETDVTPGAPPRSRSSGVPSGTITEETGQEPLSKEGEETEVKSSKPLRSRSSGVPSINTEKTKTESIPKAVVEPEVKAATVSSEKDDLQQEVKPDIERDTSESDEMPRKRKNPRSW